MLYVHLKIKIIQILCPFLRNKHYFVHHFSTSFLRKLYNTLWHFSAAGSENNVNLLFPSHKSVFFFVSQLCFLRVELCYNPIEPSTLICTIPIIYLILYNKSDSLEQKKPDMSSCFSPHLQKSNPRIIYSKSTIMILSFVHENIYQESTMCMVLGAETRVVI